MNFQEPNWSDRSSVDAYFTSIRRAIKEIENAMVPATRERWVRYLAANEYFDGELEIHYSQLKAFLEEVRSERAQYPFRGEGAPRSLEVYARTEQEAREAAEAIARDDYGFAFTTIYGVRRTNRKFNNRHIWVVTGWARLIDFSAMK